MYDDLTYRYRSRPEVKHRWQAWYRGVHTDLYLGPDLFPDAAPDRIRAKLIPVQAEAPAWPSPPDYTIHLGFDETMKETFKYLPIDDPHRQTIGTVYLPHALLKRQAPRQLWMLLTGEYSE